MDEIIFKELSLEDAPLVNSYFQAGKLPISEYTFTNLYVWNEVRKVKYARYNEGLLFSACYDREHYFLPPVGYSDHNEICRFVLENSFEGCRTLSIRRVPLEMAEGLDTSLFNLEEDFDNADYIYNVEDLALLPGRHYSNKRAWVKKFQESYNYKYLPYDKSMAEECSEMVERWLHNKGADKESCDECRVLKRFLQEYSRLHVFGAVLRVNGVLAAFAFGETMGPDMAVIHFEKADTTYTGIYQTINQLFCEKELVGRYRYVNREQDLGIQGIRKAKKSYLPHHLGRKFKVSLKEQ